MSPRPFRFPILLLLATFLLLPTACTDGDGPVGPAGERSVVVGLIASYADVAGVAGSQQINRVRIDVLDASTEESVLDAPVVQDVSPDASKDTVPVEVSFEGSVIITVELLHVDGSTETVEWSARSESVSIEAGEETAVEMPELGRGPLENLAVTDVAIDEAATDLEVGVTLALSAQVGTSDPDAPPTVFWSSSAETVATVDDEGVVTGVAAGTSAIVASAGSARDTMEITVLAPPDVTISLPAEGAAFTEQREVAFEGSSEDAEDGQLTGEALVWTSDLDGQLATGAAFATTTLTVGTHEIVLVATDSDGLVGEDTVRVVIESDQPPVATITEPADSSLFVEGTPVTFAGTAEDPEEDVLPDTALAWTSDLDGELGSGASLTSSALSAGLHQIVLTGTDSFGNIGTDSVVVEVGGPNTVTGTVFRSNDELGYESVRVRLLSDGSPLDSTLTDGLGTYRFDSIAPGTYTVAVERADLPPFGSFTVGAEEQSVTVALGDMATLDVGFEVPVVELRLVASDTMPTAGDTIQITMILTAPALPQDLAGAAGFMWNPDPNAWEHGDLVDVPDSWATGFDELALGDDDTDSVHFAVASAAGQQPDSVVVLSVDVWTEVYGSEPFMPTLTMDLDQLETVDAATGETTPLLDFVILDRDTLTLEVFDPCTQQQGYTVGNAINGTLEGGDCIWRVQEDSLGATEYLYVDDYRFSVGSQLHGVVEASSSAFALRWDLLGLLDPVSHTKQIYSQDFVGAEGITQDSVVRRRILIPAGDYGLLMWPLSLPATGAYSFQIEDVGTHDVNGCGQPYRVFARRGTQTSGSISAEDCYDAVADSLGSPGRHFDFFWVHLRGGETLTVTFQGSDSTAAVAIWGANPDTGEWESKTFHHGGTQTVQISHTAVRSGYFEVDPIGEPGMTYDISFEVTGSPSAPARVPGEESRPPAPPSVVPPGRH